MKIAVLFRRVLVAAGLGLSLGFVQAQPGDDPPAVAARVGEVIGDAWLFDPETREWTRLLRNQTLAEGDQLRTDDRSRVSLRIGSTSVWVDERSDLNLRRLDEGRMVLQLDRGDLGLRLRNNEIVGDTRIQTSEGDMLPEREGLYRVEQLDDNRGSRAYVWQGRLRFEPARGGDIPPTVLQSGEQAEFWWAGGPRVERNRLSSDGFGDWMAAEDRRENDSIAVTRRYVSPEMTGIEDLDRAGRWEQSPDYGAVWYPTAIGPDWAPYRDGHWVWTRAWGWTWVDDAPWGFAPFHYGRWVQYRGRWCWAPGAYVQRPVYAPALVAWVGGGSWSVSIGAGRNAPPRYGWYPLAPREVYVPPFRHSPVYERRVNADHGPIQGRPPARSNREVPGAISFLPGQGGGVRALPPGEARRVGPAPVVRPPSRGELAAELPRRPAPVTQAPPPNMGWRNDRDRNDRDRRGPDREGRPPQDAPHAQQEQQQRQQQMWRQQQAEQNQRAQQEQQQQQQQQRVQMEQRERALFDQQQQQQRAQQEQQQQRQQQQQQQQRAEQEQRRQQQEQQQQRGQREREQREQQEQQRAQQEQQRAQQERAQQEQARQQQLQERRASDQAEMQQRIRQQQQDQARQQQAQQQQQQQQQQRQPQQQQPQRGDDGKRDNNNRGERDRDNRGGRDRQPQQQER